MANRPPSHYPDIGVLGEDLVAQWLQSTGWIILHRRWRCRWGEIDLVAKTELKSQESGVLGAGLTEIPLGEQTSLKNPHRQKNSSPLLAFVEVKTRSSGNWDAGGLLSITPRKQAKLWQTARCFLATYPNLANYPCRFDVALVHYRKLASNQPRQPKTPATIETATSLSSMPFQIGEAIIVAGYQLVLQEYIPSAFD